MTGGPDFFKRLYCKHITGQTNKDWFAFSIPIGTDLKKSSSISYRCPYPNISET